MRSICATDCCGGCSRKGSCSGCLETGGKPFGGACIAAEYIKEGGFEAFSRLKNALIDEVNALGVASLEIADLHLLNGFYVNLEYRLANGQCVKLLEDNNIYLGNQIEIANSDRCYGIVADDAYLLVCAYGCGGIDPEIILYRKRSLSAG